MLRIVTILFLVMIGSSAFANEIYIDQIGDNLDLDITQDGQDNKIGTSTTDAGLYGDDMTFAITQTGNFNEITATIRGTDYTGTWSFTGNSNTVDLLCSSTTAGDCDTVTLNITTTGDDNDYTFNIGETTDADSSSIAFTVTGDDNIINSSIDGVSTAVAVTLNNSSSLSTNSANGDAGVAVTLDIDGDGDTNGHTVTLDITGGGSTYDVTQSGIYDNTVDATFNGDNQDVDITQSD
jgi:hypothetical protein